MTAAMRLWKKTKEFAGFLRLPAVFSVQDMIISEQSELMAINGGISVMI